MASVNPQIEWCQKSGQECLKFIFGERLTEKEADVAISAWKDAFQSKKDKAITLIWDCKHMKGYETKARDKWTKALKEMKAQIASIWLISDSAIIRMGASVMGLIGDLKIRPISSEGDIAI